jgi:hypothetical protein
MFDFYLGSRDEIRKDMLEILTVHKEADVQNSSAQFETLERKSDLIDTQRTASLLNRAFQPRAGMTR